MASQKYILPNAAAIRKLLAQESDVTSAAIIRLAWQAGLTATEIVNLRWTDINFDNGTLSVYGRIVRASSDLISFLSSMEQVGSYVIYSKLAKGGPTTRNSVSRKARLALDHVGEKASLLELRFDYIVRALKERSVEVVSRAAGCEIRTLQEINKRYTDGSPNLPVKRIRNHNNYDIDRAKLEKALEEANPLDAKIIMLAWMCGLSLREMSDLTWDNIDLSDNILSVGKKEIPIPEALSSVLRAESNEFYADGHVLKGTRSAEKITTFFLSRRAGEFFARHELGDLTLNGVKGKYSAQPDSELKKRLIQLVEQRGRMSAKEIASDLGLSKDKSAKLLHSLVSCANLKYSGGLYIPAGCQSNWDKFMDAIIQNLDSQSNVTRSVLSSATGFAANSLYYYIKQAIKKGILEEQGSGVYHCTGKK